MRNKKKLPGPVKSDQTWAIAFDLYCGKTHISLANKYGLTRQRIGQIASGMRAGGWKFSERPRK